MRAAQNFDPFEVGDVENRTLRLGDIDPVEIEADRRFPGHCGVDRHRPANCDLRDCLVRWCPLEFHIGGKRAQTIDRRDVAGIEIILADGRNRDRHFLNILFALLRGHDDDIAVRAFARLIVGLGICGGRKHQRYQRQTGKAGNKVN